MKRRDFITLLGGAAAAWPRAVRAQQPTKMPTIGVLGAGTPLSWSHWVPAFVVRLRELGWIESRNVTIEHRWAEGRSERYTEIAAELVRLKVDVILTAGAPSVVVLKQATSVIPIVFAAAGDPVGSGLVASLAQPGGNVTGLSVQQTDLAPKRLELLREAVPSLRRSRKQLVREKASHVQRVQKTLEEANIKIESVLSDVMGHSGRAIIQALIDGETDPAKLATLAHWKVRAPAATLREALRGRIKRHHRFLLQLHMQQINALEIGIAELDREVDTGLACFRDAVERSTDSLDGARDRRVLAQ